MKRIASLLAVTLLSACTVTAPGGPPPAAELIANVARAAPGEASVEETVEGLLAFGHELHERTAEPTINTIVSPFSIALAFGMARAGAAGDTADQIDEILHFPPDVHEGLNALEQDIVSGEGPPPLPELGLERDPRADPQPPVVAVANGLFVQDGVEIKPPFLDILAGQYGAGVQVVDFGAGTAKPAIDAWVREQTAERIQKLFDQLPPETAVVLANAVYLKADWQTPFAKEPLKEGPFTRADGSVVTATMMRRVDEQMRYAEGDGWQAVEIPYAGDELAMWVIVPDGDRSPTELLAPELLAQVGSGMREGVVELELPKWDFATDLDLVPPMTELGMELPFDPVADFSGMTDLDLFIEQAIHRANITVDEWGTEAAAVTGLAFPSSGPPEPDIVVHADHPFAFVIRHTATGTPLFIGQVADPTAG
ncbi:MAG: serpin family protein [Geodermatophilaceae bacterium]|nr:serpin family protein [Geodermatophilaceae bacterium]